MANIMNVTTNNGSKFEAKTIKPPGCTFPVASLLGVFFVVCKVLQIGIVADWSWVWVLSPFWLPISIVVGIPISLLLIAGAAGLLGLAVVGIFEGVSDWNVRRRYKKALRNLSLDSPLPLRGRA